MFELGDTVIYPGHGVAIIKEMTTNQIEGVSIIFFRLEFLLKEMSILIPKLNAKRTGLRPLSTEEDIAGALKKIASKNCRVRSLAESTPGGWNKRQKEYQLKVQGGDILEMATVYQELMVTQQRKELSFRRKGLTAADRGPHCTRNPFCNQACLPRCSCNSPTPVLILITGRWGKLIPSTVPMSLRTTFPAIIVMGPTASGKTSFCDFLAGHLPIEVINADATQCYQACAIGTAKPNIAQLNYPARLFDFLSQPEEFNVCRYRQLILDCLENCFKKKTSSCHCWGIALLYSVTIFSPAGTPSTI